MNLNKKWWHRLSKVIFVLLILISVSTTTYLVIDYYKPNTNIYKSTYQVSCIGFREIFGDFSGSMTNYGISLLSENDLYSNYLCSEPGIYENFQQLEKEGKKEILNNIPLDFYTQNSYELILKDEVVDGSWSQMFGYMLISLVSLFLFFSLVRYIYFYIIKNEHKYLFNERKKKN